VTAAETTVTAVAHLFDGEDEVGRDEGEDGHVEGERVPHGLQALLHADEARLVGVLPPPPLRHGADPPRQLVRVVAGGRDLAAAAVYLAMAVAADEEVVFLAVVEAARRGGDTQERRAEVLLARAAGDGRGEGLSDAAGF
jgi:hypothetical protein